MFFWGGEDHPVLSSFTVPAHQKTLRPERILESKYVSFAMWQKSSTFAEKLEAYMM